MKYFKALGGIALAVGVAVFGTSAIASPIGFYNEGGQQTDIRFTLGCSLGCEGYIFSTTSFDPDFGTITEFPNGAQNIAEAVNSATGGSYSAVGEMAPSDMFTSSAEYITIKIGGGGGGAGEQLSFAIVKNTGGANNMFTFTEVLSGAGFSHYREFGEVNMIPLPASALLLLAGLGGLAAARRKKA